jgi:repressor LexA
MRSEWTPNRKKVARFLEKYFHKYDRAPSLDEIAQGTGLWKRSVEIVLKGLEKIGYLELTPGISRGIRLVAMHIAQVPLLGEVQAGLPPLAQDTGIEYIELEKKLVPFDDPVALRIDGYSMRDAGILPGDIILIKDQQHAVNGDTIVAYYNGGMTVKTFHQKGRQVTLKPSNPSFKPIEIHKDDEFRIMGKVMLVLRDLGGCFDFKVATKPRE